MRRDRLCIPVRRGRQGELPKGSVSLAASESGNTLYVEPAPAVKLNNAEMALAGREAEEEAAVLRALSSLVRRVARGGCRSRRLCTLLSCLYGSRLIHRQYNAVSLLVRTLCVAAQPATV